MHWPWANTLVWIADIGLLLAGISYLLDGLMEKDPVKWSLKFISMLFIFLLLLVIFLSQ
jgi:hypothetical protein